MSKTKTGFFCQNCGTKSLKWVGKCSGCGEWNTIIEEVLERDSGKSSGFSKQRPVAKPRAIHDLTIENRARIDVLDAELHRVLGGGIVPGSLVLFGGEPGIGKSTLMLQLALRQLNLSVLYVSGEESEEQLKMRCERIGLNNPRCFVLMETRLEQIIDQLEETQPGLVIIDSIQTLHSSAVESSPGSISQVRDCATRLMKFAKETSTPVFLIGHITKEGTLAGPKVLEHMVDTVLQFEGDRHHVYRILRSTKNRFGSTNELGIYEMQGAGLREVSNPSEILIHTQSENLSGSAIAATLEGLRPMMIEIQALASTAVYGTPQRSTTGFDIRRLNMLLAVLEKRCGFRLGMKDVFLNIAGGLRIEDPAMDLAVVSAILSSSEDLTIPATYCFAGEVGLSGEIRPVTRIDQRIHEATKLGFDTIIISKYNKGIDPKLFAIRIVSVGKIEEVVTELFG
jgi:DNA repair protein RadA/Sms